MVAVSMRVDEVAHRLVGHAPDRGNHLPRHRRQDIGIDHHHVTVGDNGDGVALHGIVKRVGLHRDVHAVGNAPQLEVLGSDGGQRHMQAAQSREYSAVGLGHVTPTPQGASGFPVLAVERNETANGWNAFQPMSTATQRWTEL